MAENFDIDAEATEHIINAPDITDDVFAEESAYEALEQQNTQAVPEAVKALDEKDRQLSKSMAEVVRGQYAEQINDAQAGAIAEMCELMFQFSGRHKGWVRFSFLLLVVALPFYPQIIEGGKGVFGMFKKVKSHV